MQGLKFLIIVSLVFPSYGLGQRGATISVGVEDSLSFKASPVHLNSNTFDYPSLSPPNPLNPVDPLDLFGPISPFSPMNPINQMNLMDENGVALFTRVLKVENNAGTINAFQCLMHRDEFKSSEPIEQNCVLIAQVGAAQVHALETRKGICWEFSDADVVFFGLLAVLGGSLGAVGGAVAVEMMRGAIVGRYIAGGVVVGTIIAALTYGTFRNSFGMTCERAVALLAKRLYEELQGKILPGKVQILKVDDSFWNLFDAVISGTKGTAN